MCNMYQIIWRVSVSACLVQYLSKQRDRHYVGENISYSSKVFDPILFFKSSLKPGSECVTVEGLIEASVVRHEIRRNFNDFRSPCWLGQCRPSSRRLEDAVRRLYSIYRTRSRPSCTPQIDRRCAYTDLRARTVCGLGGFSYSRP